MNFRTYVELPYRDWIIQQTWNHEAIQFDRTAVKASQRVLQGAMNYHDFIQQLDLLDGTKTKPTLQPMREGEPAMTLRHDARQCREKAKSEQIRIARGYLTPEETKAAGERAERLRQAQAKEATKGRDLFGGMA